MCQILDSVVEVWLVIIASFEIQLTLLEVEVLSLNKNDKPIFLVYSSNFSV